MLLAISLLKNDTPVSVVVGFFFFFLLGTCFVFVFAPALKDENVVSDACQQAEEIY